jgi:predicted unusual protein kinase regulating ubiquinone biosynthesis (AarF/ABC1/UbiB family)
MTPSGHADDEADDVAALLARFREEDVAVPTGRLSRLWRTGRSAAGMARAVLGGARRARGEGLAAADRAAIVKLTTRLGELKGITMKLGQILGYIDPTLPPELRELLSVLQTQAPASPFSAVEATLRAAFGARADELLDGLSRAPVAVASIGQVHRGVLADGREVAVKVRHAGIEQALEADFRNAATGAVIARLFPGGSSVRGLLDEARTAMLEECDFALEAARQRELATWYADHPTITIPDPIDAWCAPAVLTTPWLPGRTLDELLAGQPTQQERDRIGGALFELFVGTLYLRGVLHADPHPGNFAIRPDGRVVIYDFGCVRRFEPGIVAALGELLRAVRADDDRALDEALRRLGAVPPTKPSARGHLRELLRGFFGPLLEPGTHAVDPGGALALGSVMRDKRAVLGLELPGSLLFLLRLRFGLYAVLARLGARADWAALELRWAAEREHA